MARETIKFSLPDFVGSFDLNYAFIELAAQNPSLLQDNVVLDNVYGCFPNCVLNGGRAFVRTPYSRSQMEETFGALAAYQTKVRLTFTNMLAKEEDLEDPYVQTMLDLGSKYGAEVIVYHDFIADYVRERYGMKCVLSTTREITDAATFNKMLQSYDYVVLNYNFNKDNAFIDALADPSKVEVMVNEYCVHGCPQRQKHYLHNSQDQVNKSLTAYDCRANKINTFLKHAPGDPVFFTDQEVASLHDKTGIHHYKIVGRGLPFEIVLESYVYYLIKPEYREEVKKSMRQQVCGARPLWG